MGNWSLGSFFTFQKPLSIMDFLHKIRQHINKDVYIWKVFESI